jgi:hypothetical protein
MRAPPCTETIAAERDRLPPLHTGHLGNANLLATTSHIGLLANSMGAIHAGLLAIFVVTISTWSHQTATLHWQTDTKPSIHRVNALLLAAFHHRQHQ